MKDSTTPNSPNNNPTQKSKSPKRKGPIRTEAVVPFIIVCTLSWLYFFLFFDLHLKKALELVGYNIIGAEVNIAELNTSFFNASFRAQKIQITNSQKPTHNLVEIGDIRFSVLWDGLLRAKFIVNEMAIEQIAIDVKRSQPGQVKPPEPKVAEDKSQNSPSALDKAKSKALDAIADSNQDNALGSLVSLLSGSNTGAEISKIEGQLLSKEKLTSFEKELKEKSKAWEEKFKSLPKPKEIQEIGDKLGKVKTKDFKNPQEVQQSLNEIDKILKEADLKYKTIQSTGGQLQDEFKQAEKEYKELETFIQQDIQSLQKKFRIPSLDAKSISVSIFEKYLAPYRTQVDHYAGLYKRYAPPNIGSKNSNPESESIKPHKREKGIVYEFPKENSYPLFWIKKIIVSSKASDLLGTGNLEGKVLDITSNQKLIRKPTVAEFKGDFPVQKILGFESEIKLDLTKPESELDIRSKIAEFKVEKKDLINSSDLSIGFDEATGSSNSQIRIVGFKSISGEINSRFDQVKYLVDSKSSEAKSTLISMFNRLPPITLQAGLGGSIPDIDFDISSNIGTEIERSFKVILNSKINEAQAKIKAYVDGELGAVKANIDQNLQSQKKLIEGELKKITDQVNSEKSKADSKMNQAKKDAENQGKKGLESELKKALGSDGDKKIDDLKKKFGL